MIFKLLRDIKLENILIEPSGRLKLIDFGFCTCSKERLRIFCGTPSYMCPEIVSKKEYLGPPTDVWAAGVLLYVIICGCFPFKSTFERELYRKIQKGIYSFPLNMPEGPKRVVEKILQVDPAKRPTASEVLEDPWVALGAPS